VYFYQSYRKNKSRVPFILDHPTYINTLGTPSKDSVCYASYITDEVFTKCTEAIYTKWLLTNGCFISLYFPLGWSWFCVIKEILDFVVGLLFIA